MNKIHQISQHTTLTEKKQTMPQNCRRTNHQQPKHITNQVTPAQKGQQPVWHVSCMCVWYMVM